MKTLALIPAYNEGERLVKTVEETKKYVDDILVVDDGSKEKVVLDVKVVRNEPNKGKGYSLLRGFKYAVDNGYDYVVALDADGEHKPHQIKEFIEKAKDYDFVVGQRAAYRNLKRRMLNSFANFWFALLIPGIKDMYCGYRGIKVDAYQAMKLEGARFELEPEMLLEAVKRGIKIGYVDVETDPLEKTNFTARDYLRTNELYDKWILKNYSVLRVSFLKKYFLFFSAHIGLVLTRMLK